MRSLSLACATGSVGTRSRLATASPSPLLSRDRCLPPRQPSGTLPDGKRGRASVARRARAAAAARASSRVHAPDRTSTRRRSRRRRSVPSADRSRRTRHAARTPGVATSTASTCVGWMFSPPEMMTSSARPSTWSSVTFEEAEVGGDELGCDRRAVEIAGCEHRRRECESAQAPRACRRAARRPASGIGRAPGVRAVAT